MSTSETLSAIANRLNDLNERLCRIEEYLLPNTTVTIPAFLAGEEPGTEEIALSHPENPDFLAELEDTANEILQAFRQIFSAYKTAIDTQHEQS